MMVKGERDRKYKNTNRARNMMREILILLEWKYERENTE